MGILGFRRPLGNPGHGRFGNRSGIPARAGRCIGRERAVERSVLQRALQHPLNRAFQANGGVEVAGDLDRARRLLCEHAGPRPRPRPIRVMLNAVVDPSLAMMPPDQLPPDTVVTSTVARAVGPIGASVSATATGE